jgi:hypothetical protein
MRRIDGCLTRLKLHRFSLPWEASDGTVRVTAIMAPRRMLILERPNPSARGNWKLPAAVLKQAQCPVSSLQARNDCFQAMGITGQANRERPQTTHCGNSHVTLLF